MVAKGEDCRRVITLKDFDQPGQGCGNKLLVNAGYLRKYATTLQEVPLSTTPLQIAELS